jgi:hypothetical protein
MTIHDLLQKLEEARSFLDGSITNYQEDIKYAPTIY